MIRVEDGIYVIEVPELGILQKTDPATGLPFASEAAAQSWIDGYTAAHAAALAAAMVAEDARRAAEALSIAALPRFVSGFEFLRRFTVAERIAVRALAKTDPVAEDFLHILDSAIASGTAVWTDDPDLISGMGYLSANPTGSPVLNATRAAQILA